MQVTVNHIYKSYQHRPLLSSIHQHMVIEDVSFHIPAGHSLGLIGESGSGKTTLAHLLCGLEQPDRGTIRFYPRTDSHSHARVNMVFQDYTSSINPTQNVRQVLAESLQLSPYLDRHLHPAALSLLNQIGLSASFLTRYVHELSGGEVQRLCIGRALATRPNLLILDEPISALDVPHQLHILDLLKKLQYEWGMSYLFIAHDIKAVCYFCDEILFLQQKKIVARYKTTELNQIQHPYARTVLKAII